ncbi:hypothetical protein ACFVXE_35665 [Streptomyces sp. NPDC058231]|uniref:hypothetical protein n=1 Tax=Streptomyces sp. NPDC058231 TaxID=3346392 RepID=UPI0036E200CD
MAATKDAAPVASLDTVTDNLQDRFGAQQVNFLSVDIAGPQAVRVGKEAARDRADAPPRSPWPTASTTRPCVPRNRSRNQTATYSNWSPHSPTGATAQPSPAVKATATSSGKPQSPDPPADPRRRDRAHQDGRNVTAPTRPGPTAEKALREAKEQLFTGRPIHTDGKLTKQNLWQEAGVSQATMNRTTAVPVDWDTHVSQSSATKHDQSQAAEITRLRHQLRDNRHERQQLQNEADTAATVITALLAENTALREQIAQRSAVVIPTEHTPHATRE